MPETLLPEMLGTVKHKSFKVKKINWMKNGRGNLFYNIPKILFAWWFLVGQLVVVGSLWNETERP